MPEVNAMMLQTASHPLHPSTFMRIRRKDLRRGLPEVLVLLFFLRIPHFNANLQFWV
jgi:hypothetical protein